MQPETLFSLCSTLVLPGWLLLIFAPGWKWTQRITALISPLLLGLVYLALVTTNLGNSGGGFSTLALVAQLFENPWLLLAGWVHYLAFDLLIGAWQVRDARRLQIPHLAVFPCLLLTFMLGPVGWLAYSLLRAVMRREFEVS